MLLRRHGWVPSLGAAAVLFVCPSAARANAGSMTIAGLTPISWGWGYLLALIPVEALVIQRVAKVTWQEACHFSLVANVVSALVGGLLGALGFSRFFIEPILPALGLVGIDPYHPVPRLLTVTVFYYVASVAIEAPCIGAYLPRRTAWRASAAANGVTYALAALLLLLSPYPYAYTSMWRIHRMYPALNRALREYKQDHQGRPPPETGPCSVTRALVPYLSPTPESLVRDGRLVCYDRLRLDGRYPEWPLVLEGENREHCYVYSARPAPYGSALTDKWPVFPRLLVPLVRSP